MLNYEFRIKTVGLRMKNIILLLLGCTLYLVTSAQAQNTEYSRSGGKYLEMVALYRQPVG